MLNRDGRCAIYSDRPDPCRVFAVGSEECIGVIQRRRPSYWRQLEEVS